MVVNSFDVKKDKRSLVCANQSEARSLDYRYASYNIAAIFKLLKTISFIYQVNIHGTVRILK